MRTKIGRRFFFLIGIAILFCLALGLLLGLWTAREMETIITDQFNDEQMAIAQTLGTQIERQLAEVKKELGLLADDINGKNSTAAGESIRQSIVRLSDKGLWKVGLTDLRTRQTTVYPAHHQTDATPIVVEETISLPHADLAAAEEVRIFESVIASPMGLELTMAAPVVPKQITLLFHINLTRLLTPILRDVRSGDTGYVWLMDQTGNFLYHPHAPFVGKNAFQIRQAAFPSVSYEKINFIQKEQMLKGEQGTGRYFSGWHRGISGRQEKLIAFCPVMLDDSRQRFWSIAVVAPTAEIDTALRRGSFQMLALQGLVILVVLGAASAIVYREMRWSRVLEDRVRDRTEALMKSEADYRSLVESAEDFIFTFDRELKFQSLNSFTANFFGGRLEDYPERHLAEIFPEGVMGRLDVLAERIFASGKSTREELELPLAESAIWISANFMPIKSQKGDIVSILCIARDITESKNLERQLVNAEKLASLGTLAAGVAHEINNPLGVILGFCDLLMGKSAPGSQQYDDLKIIERQGLHCKEIVENLLSFARIDHRGQDHCDVNDCLQTIVRIVGHMLEMNQIDLTIDLAPALPCVKGDSRQLQQVFLNLITNAVAAMPAGGRLSIRSYLERGSRKAVVLVGDTGVGIPAENLDRIYEPFFTTKPEGKGTGLGLFVSYGIVSKYGGSIECASLPANPAGRLSGTTFTVKLLTLVGDAR